MVDVEDILQFVGLVVLARFFLLTAYSALGSVYAFFLHKVNLKKKYGSYAVITGATDGIGKAYAIEFAKRGLNLVLISRTAEKLTQVATEIQASLKNPVEIQTIAFNFDQDSSAYDALAEKLASVEIGILVNNVGVSYDVPVDLLELPQERLDSLVRVNIVSMNQMTRIALRGMVERKKGAIINLSSGSAMHPTPLLTVYSATKAYVDFFSRALSVEYASKGIDVQDVMPFFVATNMSKMRPSFTTPSAKNFARQAVNSLGVQKVTNGVWIHAIQGWVLSLVPSFLLDRALFNINDGLRKRALKRAALKKN